MKLSENDVEEEDVPTVWGKSLLSDAIIYCSSSKFEDCIDRFRGANSHVFESYVEAKDPENEEQSLECTEIFQEYQSLVEGLLEDFVAQNGVSMKEFYAECKSAVDGDFTPLFQDHEHKWFVDIILSWLDYSYFFNEMVRFAASSKRSRK